MTPFRTFIATHLIAPDPNPTSSRLDLLDGVGVLESLDFEESKECESRHHDRAGWLHEGFAEFLQIGYCAHTTGLRCAKYVSSAPRLRGGCSECGTERPPDFAPTFIPLTT